MAPNGGKKRPAPEEEEKKGTEAVQLESGTSTELPCQQKSKKRTMRRREKARNREAIKLKREAIREAKKHMEDVEDQKEQGEMPYLYHKGKTELVLKKTPYDPEIDLPKVLDEIQSARKTCHVAKLLDFKIIPATKEAEAKQVETYPLYRYTLEALIEESKGKGLGLENSTIYLYGILDAIASFHKAGYIHGDIKPNNIALTTSKVLKLIDFGNIVKIRNIKRKSSTTPYYRFDGMRAMEKTDLWAAGCIYVEMLLGKTMRESSSSDPQKDIAKAKKEIEVAFPKDTAQINGVLDSLFELDKDVSAETLLRDTIFEGRQRQKC
jgi:serine/threonine protein kinase